MGRLRRDRVPAPAGAPQSVAGHDEHLRTVAHVLGKVAEGDLEVRIPPLPGAGQDLLAMRSQLNRALDVVDAFVRESQVSLVAAAEGRFHRRMLVRGLPGAFRVAAEKIGAAHQAMQASAERLAEQEAARLAIVDHAVEVSTHVAAASTELFASAGSLAASARSGVGEVDGALATVQQLEETAERIGETVQLIRNVASTTRMLALNATIESARAGEAGKGFAVVASEVKRLADDTAMSSGEIARQVEDAQAAAQEAARAMSRLTQVIRDIDQEVAGIALAAGDGESGLARLAEELRVHIGRFAG